MSHTRRLVRSLAEERGYTMSLVVDEAVRRGYGSRGEAVGALRWAAANACPMYLPALRSILGLGDEEVERIWNALMEDADSLLAELRDAA